jgi:hypothetical protein
MPVELKDHAAALEYEATTEYDHWLEIPPDKKGECKCKAYVGYLSNITEHAAERYLKSGGNLIRRKEQILLSIDNDSDFDSNPDEQSSSSVS